MGEPLKPCPFCGGEFKITKHFKEDLWRGVHRCPEVGALVIEWMATENSLIKRWNARAPDPHIAKLEGLLREARLGDGWRPIESAPLDGSRIWAFHPDRHQGVVWWETGRDGEYWQNDADSEPEPTYWRPLPAPPKESA